MEDTSNNSDDEVRRKLLKPKVSEEEALSILIDLYCSDGFDNNIKVPRVQVIQELDSYDDINYLVEINGEKALFKIHNGVESEQYIIATQSQHDNQSNKCLKVDETDTPSNGKTSDVDESSGGGSIIDLHSAIYDHMADTKYNITTGKTIKPSTNSTSSDDNTSGVCIRELSVVSPQQQHSPCQLVIRLQSWVHGTPLSSIEYCPIETLLDCGVSLANMCHALDDLATKNPTALAASKRYHAWDGKNLLDVKPYVSYIDDENQSKLVTSVLDEFDKIIIKGKAGEKFRCGIIHGDFNDANIIIGDDMKVAGVIDFGDTVYSWRVLDVSVAMTYAMISSYGKGKRSISAACAVLRGFHHKYPLTNDERMHLRLLIACRLALSATMGNYSYKQNPQNEYLLLHAKPAWEALEFIWGSDEAVTSAIEHAFKIACDVSSTSSAPNYVDISFPDPSIIDPMSSVRIKSKMGSTAQENEESVVTFVTGNKKKAEEVKRILSTGGELPFTLVNHKVDLPELQGEAVDVAREKCALAAKEIGGAVITEDTSLCFNALNGMPGVYIKWFLEANGLDGLNDMISFSDDKSGYAQTIVAFCAGPGDEVLTFDGRTQGNIVRPRGELAFGWDPIFEPTEEEQGKDSVKKTYAEMTGAEKDSISHRKRAFVKLREYIDKKYA